MTFRSFNTLKRSGAKWLISKCSAPKKQNDNRVRTYNFGRQNKEINSLKCSGVRQLTFKSVQCHPGLTYIFNF